MLSSDRHIEGNNIHSISANTFDGLSSLAILFVRLFWLKYCRWRLFSATCITITSLNFHMESSTRTQNWQSCMPAHCDSQFSCYRLVGISLTICSQQFKRICSTICSTLTHCPFSNDSASDYEWSWCRYLGQNAISILPQGLLRNLTKLAILFAKR